MRTLGRRQIIGSLLILLLAAGCFTWWQQQPAQAAILGNLAGYWKLDEASGTTAADASGNGRNATLSGTQNWTTGRHNNGFSFSGAGSNYMSTSLGWPSTGGTLSTWVKPNAINDWTGPAGWKQIGSTNGYVLLDMGNGEHPWRAVFRPNISGNNEISVQSSVGATTGSWTHLAMTWSLSSGTYTVTLYVNGVSQGSASWTGTQGAGGMGNLRIGNTGDYNDNHFNGSIDETRVYSRAISATEVSALYDNNRTTATWTGGTNTDFTVGSNWSTGAVPDNYTDVTIGPGTNRAVLTQNTDVASMAIASGGTLDLAGYNVSLNAGSSITNNGTLISRNSETLPTTDSSNGTVMYTNTGNVTGLRFGNSYKNLTINSGLGAYWPMDEASTGSLTDASGYGVKGTAAGATGAQNLPQPSTSVPTTNFTNTRSLSFDGTDDIITTGNPFTGNDFTISAWVNPAVLNTGSYQGFLGRENGYGGWTHRAPGLWVGDMSSALHYDSYDTSGTRYSDVLNNFFTSANQWVHITWVKSGTTYTIYRNGTSFATRTAPTTLYRGGNDYTIGGINNFLNGKLDDVRIYSRALSGSEVTSLSAGNQPAISSGTTTLNSPLTVTGSLSLNSGALDVSTSNHAVNVAGNWTNHGGVFTPRNGTVTLNGANQAFNSSNTFYNLTKTVAAARTLTFAARSTTSVTGTATLTGASGQLLSLASDTPGTQWRFNPSGTVNASYVSISDSNNVGIAAGATSSSNGGNNTNWGFTAPNAPGSLGPTSVTNGVYGTDTTPDLNFSLSDPEAGDTLRYRLQIDDTSDYSSPVVDYTSALAAAGTRTFTVGQAAGSGTYTTGSGGQTLSNGTYYWRVMTMDSSNLNSGWTTASSGAPAFGIDTAAPSTPGRPGTTTPTTNNTPVWNWTASTDSGSGLANPAYTVEWSQSSTFASGVTTATSNTNSYTHSAALSDGTWYVRVRAADTAANTSAYSATGSVYINTLNLTGSSTAGHEPGTTLQIPDLQVTGNGNPTIPVKLRVTSGTLSFGSSTGLTFTGSSSGNTLYFSGSLNDVNAALDTLRYNRASVGTDTLEVSLVQPGEVFFEDTGHLYEFVTGTTTWTQAQAAAALRSKYGAAGYLATITSASENSFVAARLSNAGWMGASDVGSEGTWKWVTGPESGTTFSNGNSPNMTTASGQYQNWNSGEPNDSGNEDCGQFLSGSGNTGKWNDLACSGTTLPGYVVEYGAPDNMPLVPAKNISITTNDVTSPTTPSNLAVSGSSPTADNTPTWSWTASTDGGSGLANPAYTIQRSLSSDFSSGVTSATTNTTAYTTGTLSDGLWYFRVRSTDQQGNTSNWASGSVEIDTTAPSVPGTPTTSTPTNNTMPTWNWTASTDSGVGMGNPSYTVQWSQSASFASGVTTNTSTITNFTQPSGLADGTWYFRVRASDSLGNTSAYSSAGSAVIDSVAPIISNIEASGETDQVAVITWNTDEATSSQLEYGPNSAAYATQTNITNTNPRVTNHTVNLTNLVPCTKYYFRTVSVDASGNLSHSNAGHFFTEGCAGGAAFSDQVDTPAPAVSDVSLQLMSDGSGVHVTAPAGFAGSDVSLQLKHLHATDALAAIGKPQAALSPIGSYIYDIKALLNEDTAVSNLTKNVTIRMHYKGNEIAGLSEPTLAIWRWDDSQGWSALNSCAVDETANTVTCTTNHFSTFALFGSAVAPATNTPDSNPAPSSPVVQQTSGTQDTQPDTTSAQAPRNTDTPVTDEQKADPSDIRTKSSTAPSGQEISAPTVNAGHTKASGWKFWWLWLIIVGMFFWFVLAVRRRRKKHDTQ